MKHWRYLSGDARDRCTAIAADWDAQSDLATNTRRWTDDFNLKGVVGQELYEWMSGIPMREGREDFRDGGFDFPGLDVKASAHIDSPWLLLSSDEPLKAPIYFCAVVDLARWRARAAGYASRKMLLGAEIVNLGHGPSYRLKESELVEPDWVLPRVILEYEKKLATA